MDEYDKLQRDVQGNKVKALTYWAVKLGLLFGLSKDEKPKRKKQWVKLFEDLLESGDDERINSCFEPVERQEQEENKQGEVGGEIHLQQIQAAKAARPFGSKFCMSQMDGIMCAARLPCTEQGHEESHEREVQRFFDRAAAELDQAAEAAKRLAQQSARAEVPFGASFCVAGTAEGELCALKLPCKQPGHALDHELAVQAKKAGGEEKVPPVENWRKGDTITLRRAAGDVVGTVESASALSAVIWMEGRQVALPKQVLMDSLVAFKACVVVDLADSRQATRESVGQGDQTAALLQAITALAGQQQAVPVETERARRRAVARQAAEEQ
jgi:hypothetical protein